MAPMRDNESKKNGKNPKKINFGFWDFWWFGSLYGFAIQAEMGEQKGKEGRWKMVQWKKFKVLGWGNGTRERQWKQKKWKKTTRNKKIYLWDFGGGLCMGKP